VVAREGRLCHGAPAACGAAPPETARG